MSDTQSVWMIVWNHAARASAPGEPFEISEVAAQVAGALHVSIQEAATRVVNLLGELERMPEGRQYFVLEGNAIVPLSEFTNAPKDSRSALAAYPYEL